MKRAHIAFCVLAFVGLLLAWNTLVYGPKSRQQEEVKAQVASARSENQTLEVELADLREARNHQETDRAALDRIHQLMPSDDEMASFIRSMDDLARSSSVDWAALAPSEAAAAPGEASNTISISINVSGTFFQLLDYLDGLATLDRLVVIDSLQMSGSGTNAAGELTLQAALSGRIFVGSGGPGPAAPASGEAADDAVAAAATGGN